MFKHFVASFLAKSIASFDDALTRIPVIAQVTKTRMGKVAFSIGNFLAVGIAIVVAFGFSKIIDELNYAHNIAAILIFSLALIVHFDLFAGKKKKRQKKHQKTFTHHMKFKRISKKRFVELIGIGFVVSFVTLIDDSIVLTPLFLGDWTSHIVAVFGIFASTLVQIVAMIFFAEKLSRFKYTKQTAVAGLVFLSIAIWFQIL